MISFLTYDNLYKFGPAFSSQFRLRHRSFKERQEYDVNAYQGMEYDQYDTPATAYLIYQSPETGEALGMSRLAPTSQCCMVRDLWPILVEDKKIINQPDVWESTRFCVDKDLSPQMRRRISDELVLAHVEMGLMLGIKKIIGVMPTLIFHSVFKKAGCDFNYLGGQIKVDGMKVRAAGFDVTQEQLSRMRNVCGIAESVLTLDGGYHDQIMRAA